jgi:hypothetical protein
VTYADLRAANAQAYCRQNAAFFGLVPTWGPLWNCAGQMGTDQFGRASDPQSLFNRIHDAGIQAIAAQQTQVDWSQTYAAIKPLLEAQPLITAIQSARWELATSAAEYDERLTLTKELLARHIRDAFARAGLQHLTRIRSAQTALDEPHATAIDPSTLLATIITAVLGVVCPPTRLGTCCRPKRPHRCSRGSRERIRSDGRSPLHRLSEHGAARGIAVRARCGARASTRATRRWQA